MAVASLVGRREPERGAVLLVVRVANCHWNGHLVRVLDDVLDLDPLVAQHMPVGDRLVASLDDRCGELVEQSVDHRRVLAVLIGGNDLPGQQVLGPECLDEASVLGFGDELANPRHGVAELLAIECDLFGVEPFSVGNTRANLVADPLLEFDERVSWLLRIVRREFAADGIVELERTVEVGE